MKKRNKAVVRQAAKHADAVRAGIAASFVASQVTDAWFNSNHSDLTPQQARDWARVNVVLASGAVYAALEAIYSTGFQLGKATSAEAYAQAALGAGADLTPEFKAILRTNWDTWKPGNPPAAMLVNPPQGFAEVLARRDIVLRGIDKTTTDRIGTLLADGLSKGLPADQVASRLEDLGLDSSRALTIATTEMNTAVQDAQFQSYKDNGVTQVEWSVVQPCDECAENDGEIRDLGDEFPSGDIKPLVHPNCLCELIPVIDLSQYDLSEADNIDMGDILDLAVVADLTKFNENHDERGRFSAGDGASSSGSNNTSYKDVPMANLNNPQQAAAVNYYVNGGSEIVNAGLRNPDSIPAYYKDEFKANSEALKNMVNENTLPTDVTVQRVMTNEAFGVSESELPSLVGSTYSDKGFLSTATMRDTAGNVNDLRALNGDSRPVRMIIDAPAGTHAIAMNPMESEILFAPNTPISITSVSKVDGGYDIYGSVVKNAN